MQAQFKTGLFSLLSSVLNSVLAKEFGFKPSLRPKASVTLIFGLTSVLV